MELFGITNVPFGLWVDEQGTIVRPAEVAFAPRDQASGPEAEARAAAAAAAMPEHLRPVMEGMRKNMGDTHRYVAALRDWVTKGADSHWTLSPGEVVERSRPRPPEVAMAAAEFELGQHLHREGHVLDAVPHFQEAHRLDPQNWSYPRNAMSLVNAAEVYGTDLLSEVARVGADSFYPALDM